jgi:hypothetical protein
VDEAPCGSVEDGREGERFEAEVDDNVEGVAEEYL